jgi:hypothetical protein
MTIQANRGESMQAGGNVGKWIVTSLLESNFNVTALSRAESQSELNNSAVNVVKGDYNDAAFLTKALTGQDALVLAVASGSLDTQKNLIDAAVAAGVKRIIPSEFGSVSRKILSSEIFEKPETSDRPGFCFAPGHHQRRRGQSRPILPGQARCHGISEESRRRTSRHDVDERCDGPVL